LAHPHDRGKNMEPAHAEVEPFPDRRDHLATPWQIIDEQQQNPFAVD
jgi:hypothetical protein